MSIQMVNGYPCANCADAALAKQGVDPTKASNLSEGLALEAARRTDHALTSDAVASASGVEQPRAKLDYSAEIDILV